MATPLVLRLLTAERQGFWQEITTLSGLLACALLVAVIVLPSRFRSLTRGFGIEKVMGDHKTLGIAVTLLVLGHIASVVIGDPRGVSLIVPFLKPVEAPESVAPAPLLLPLLTPPYRALAGLAAASALVALAGVSSRGRRYERWRAWHVWLTVLVLGGTTVHVLLINHLVPTYQIINYLFRDPLGFAVLRAAIVDPVALVYLIILGVVSLSVGVHRWVLRPLSWTGRYEVADVRKVTPTVHLLTLKSKSGSTSRFRAGQFAWLRLQRDPFGEEHPFTVSSAESSGLVEFTIRDTGSWTAQVPKLQPGDRVYLDGPHGNFTPPEHARGPLVLIAGGVGLAPMMSILRTAAAQGRHAHKRDILLILTDRSRDRIFREELRALSLDLNLTVEELNDARLDAEWIGLTVPADWEPEYYICGSPSLVAAAVTALTELRTPTHRIHTERFDM